MTKTLTEQWRNEELPIALYYVIDKLGRETIGNDCGIRYMMVDAFNGGNIFIEEVLAPVPSYDEWQAELASNDELLTVQKRLEKRLEIATKALIRIREVCAYNPNQPSYIAQFSNRKAKTALKEMEGVK